MRRTSAALLLGLAVAGGAVGWLLQVALASAGAPTFTPPLTTWVVLFVIAVVVVLLGRPVRRAVRAARSTASRLDPFFAMRVLMLAKASSILGAFALGMGVALVLYAVSRTGDLSAPGLWPDGLLGAGGLAMLVAGLVVESWCRIPPEDQAPQGRSEAEAR